MGQHQTHHGIRNIIDISIAECCLATKYLKLIKTKWNGEGDNGCGIQLLGVTSNNILQTEQHSPLRLMLLSGERNHNNVHLMQVIETE